VTREPVIDTSYRFCEQLARREARNFYGAFRLLPGDRRRSMCALYAFMRHTDDLADEPGLPADKAGALQRWSDELDAVLAGETAIWAGLPALADTVLRHGIPPHLLHEVIEGVRMDVEPRQYTSFEELARYCYHVASAVGLCCLHIWGYESDGGRAERLAESCGIALQLTNILRDVREDAAHGRVYLPQEELARFGVDPRELQSEQLGAPLRDLLASEARRARGYYEQARELVPLVHPVGRPVLLAIVGVYRALLDEIVRRDYNVLRERVAVPTWRKCAIVLAALPHRFLGPRIAQTATPVA
jgi:phytoene synthase